MTRARIFILFVLMHIAGQAFSQHAFTIQSWKRIDSCIQHAYKLNDLRLEIDSLTVIAEKAKDENNYIRCLYDRILIADQQKEDSFYFRNSAILDEMLDKSETNADRRFYLLLLKAKRLSIFAARTNLKFNRDRYRARDLAMDYAAMTVDQLDSTIGVTFSRARLLSANLLNKDPNDLLWLCSDPLVFLFKPNAYDIAIGEEIFLCSQSYRYVYGEEKPEGLLELSPDSLISRLDRLPNGRFVGTNMHVLNLYDEWIHFHSFQPAEYYFIESLARKFLLGEWDNINNHSLYADYLKKNSTSPYQPVKAFAIYQLCLWWDKQASVYFPQFPRTTFDTSFQYLSARALQLYETNREMLDSFAWIKTILEDMRSHILSQGYSLAITNSNVPDKPLLAELKYKNILRLYYRIVKKDFGETMPASAPQKIRWLLGKPVARDGSFDLPLPKDHNNHRAALKLDALPAGEYGLLFSKDPIDEHNSIETISFSVTGIAAVNIDNRVYVLDRGTGLPLQGATAGFEYSKTLKTDTGRATKRVREKYSINSKGYLPLKKDLYGDLYVYHGRDTIKEAYSFNDPSDFYEERPYDKDLDDDLESYYDDNTRVEIFTDRAIYRPGQQVFYKVLFMTRNRYDGGPLVINKKNIGANVYEKLLKLWAKNDALSFDVDDAFGNTIDSIKLTLNDFGTCSGSFRIPLSAATGSWNIEAIDFNHRGRNNGQFEVEEYKRPQFEVGIEKPKTFLLPFDPFSITITTRSFAGANLAGTRIAYQVQYNASLSYPDSPRAENARSSFDRDLVDSVGYTNENGELEIRLDEASLKDSATGTHPHWQLRYRVSVTATDATGESHEEESSFYISSRPVSIAIDAKKIYNRDELSPVLIGTRLSYAGRISEKVHLKVYRVTGGYSDNRKSIEATDQSLYSEKQLEQFFPGYAFNDSTVAEKEELVYEQMVNTGDYEKLQLSNALFSAGCYRIKAICEEGENLLGKAEKEFSVFDVKENKIPGDESLFYHISATAGAPGDTLRFYSCDSINSHYTIYHLLYTVRDKKGVKVEKVYKETFLEKGVREWAFTIPRDITGNQIEMVQVFVSNNEIYTHSEKITVIRDAGNPEMIIEQYRKKLTPASKTSFSVSVKVKDENIAAEMMTTIYDASLDKLKKHYWEVPDFGANYLRSSYPEQINTKIKGDEYDINDRYYFNYSIPGHANWWMDKDMTRFTIRPVVDDDERYTLNGKIAGVLVQPGLGTEVIVTALGVRKQLREVGYATVSIRGNNSVTDLSQYGQMLIVLDGVVYTGDIKTINSQAITAGIILKGADATAIYGARAAQGVLVLSTKGPIILPGDESPPPVQPRHDFSETAFFSPNIYAGRDGYYNFTFTMPESVTEWNWKLFAHTKDTRFAYTERKLNTQLPLMVQPAMPRLLYQGDRIVLQSRITNLDTSAATGIVNCRIEDAVTGEDISAHLLSSSQVAFSVGHQSNTTAGFEIKVPVGQLNPLKIAVTGRSQNFADGEEYTIPVISPAVFVRQSLPFSMNHMDTTLQSIKMPEGSELYGIGLSVLPKPQSALVNSLPYLANYSFDCAEQSFNKLLAQSVGLHIMRTDSFAQHSFEKIKWVIDKREKTNTGLPDQLADQTMPWLGLDNMTTRSQRDLFNLLDSSESIPAIRKHFERLKDLQNADGGLTWFPGGKSDYYISCYVLAGFGKMKKDGLNPVLFEAGNSYNGFVHALINYCDSQFLVPAHLWQPAFASLYYGYARSYWTDQQKFSSRIQAKLDSLLVWDWNHLDDQLVMQSLLLINTFRYDGESKNELYKRASDRLESLYQMANQDASGLRWKNLADADELNFSSEEALELLSEAFECGGRQKEVNPGIIKWLLLNRNEQHWSNTKATASVIHMLESSNTGITGATAEINMLIDTAKLTVTDDLLTGRTFSFIKTKNKSAQLKLFASHAGVKGNLSWYYFAPGDSLENLNGDTRMQKKLYRYNKEMASWEMITAGTILKIAADVKVVLTIQTSKPLQYVYIDDKRAAGLEPKDIESGYRYEQELGYYESVRDQGYQFFINSLPSGRWEISYEAVVSQEGQFLNGPASLQCMYRPAVNAYSNSIRISAIK